MDKWKVHRFTSTNNNNYIKCQWPRYLKKGSDCPTELKRAKLIVSTRNTWTGGKRVKKAINANTKDQSQSGWTHIRQRGLYNEMLLGRGLAPNNRFQINEAKAHRHKGNIHKFIYKL